MGVKLWLISSVCSHIPACRVQKKKGRCYSCQRTVTIHVAVVMAELDLGKKSKGLISSPLSTGRPKRKKITSYGLYCNEEQLTSKVPN